MQKKQFWCAVLKRPFCLLIPLFQTNILRWMPDELYLRFEYWIIMGKKLHLNTPVAFNEKIQWIKLHDRKPLYQKLADKHQNRDFIKKNIGEQYLIPLLGVWENADDIDFATLPERFALKCTHGYGGIVLCHDKKTLDVEQVKKSLNRTLAKDFYPRGREWAYKGAKPQIIAEELIDDGGGTRPADYKFFCMNGKVGCVCVSRSLGMEEPGYVSFFRPNGEREAFKRVDYPDYSSENPIPECFEEMKDAATKLAKASGALFIRVDFYEMNSKVFFSEFTFYPCGGTMFLDPPEYDKTLGNLLNIY